MAVVTESAIGAESAVVHPASRAAAARLADPETSELAVRLEGNASGGLDKRATDSAAVVAAFTRRSYRPGGTAVLNLWHRYSHVQIQLLHVGPEYQLTIGDETIEGVPVGEPIRVAGDHGPVRIR